VAQAEEAIEAGVLHAEPYFDDPFPVWERLRHGQPLFRDTVDERWLLTRYDDVVAVMSDHETYSTRPYERIFTDVIGPTMVQMDGPDHDVRRAIVAPPMVGMALRNNFVPVIDGVVEALFDALPADGPIDLIDRVTAPLPLRVVATMLGLDPAQDVYLREVTETIIAALAGVEPAKSAGIAKHEEFTRYVDGLIDERTARPGRDLISAIAHGRTEAGEQLSRAEIASFITLLMVAGGETTDRALANFWFTLLEHPDVLADVRADPDLLEPAFTEFMRRDGVVVYEDRELRHDVEWYGQPIAAGETVRVALISANNDETVFADPRRFDLRRTDLRLGKESRGGGRTPAGANHLGFGIGKHFCIGYQLARAEIVAATRQLLARFPELELVPGLEPTMRVDWFHRHLDRLVVQRPA
jgi:cytochrome P450